METLAVQRKNLLNFLAWARKNRDQIRPRKDTIKVFYTGDMINMGEIGRKAKAADKREDVHQELDKHIAKLYRMMQQMTTPPKGRSDASFSSIDTMLARWRASRPLLFDPGTDTKVRTKDLKDYVYMATGKAKSGETFLPSGDSAKVFRRLSKIYARNTEGEIMLLDAGLVRVDEIKKSNDFVHAELRELIKNSKISKASKAEVVNAVKKYLAAYGKEQARVKKDIKSAQKELRKKLR